MSGVRRALCLAAAAAAALVVASPGSAAGTACNPGTSTLVASETSVPADGTWPSTLTATCLDVSSSPLAGRTVFLLQTGGSSTIAPLSAVTGANGVATFQVTDATPEGPVTYRAADQATGSLWTSTAQVTFVYCDDTIVPMLEVGGGVLFALLLGGVLVLRQIRRSHAV